VFDETSAPSLLQEMLITRWQVRKQALLATPNDSTAVALNSDKINMPCLPFTSGSNGELKP